MTENEGCKANISGLLLFPDILFPRSILQETGPQKPSTEVAVQYILLALSIFSQLQPAQRTPWRCSSPKILLIPTELLQEFLRSSREELQLEEIFPLSSYLIQLLSCYISADYNRFNSSNIGNYFSPQPECLHYANTDILGSDMGNLPITDTQLATFETTDNDDHIVNSLI